MLLLRKDAIWIKECKATYQQCMQSYFEGQIGCNLEAYISNIVVRIWQGSSLIPNMEENFANLRHFNIRLNPEKCTFGVSRGKLLGYIITKPGIEVNPDKISAITLKSQVRNVKDVQWRMGCRVALNHFLSRLGNAGSPV
jgi:hypothetical protein